MKKKNTLLKVPNINSSDAHVKNLIYKVEDDLFNSHYKLCDCNVFPEKDLIMNK